MLTRLQGRSVDDSLIEPWLGHDEEAQQRKGAWVDAIDRSIDRSTEDSMLPVCLAGWLLGERRTGRWDFRSATD